jgi:hypothetical protein
MRLQPLQTQALLYAMIATSGTLRRVITTGRLAAGVELPCGGQRRFLLLSCGFGQASRQGPGLQELHPSCCQPQTAAGAAPGRQPVSRTSPPPATTWRRPCGA